MSNMSFCFRHCFCCPLVPLKVMQHVQVSYLIIGLTINAISVTITVKGWHWRWLIYALHNFLLHNNMLRVFRSNHHCSWKFRKFHRKTPVLESLFFLKMMKLYKDICSAWINQKVEKKTFVSQQTSIYYTDILKFYEVLFCTYCKGLLCL